MRVSFSVVPQCLESGEVFRGTKADAQKINAFSSLQQKLGDIGQSVSNGKSNLQQILEHLE